MPESFPIGEEPWIVHDDDRFLVAWKPAGFHTAPGGEDGFPCLADWIFARYPEVAHADACPPAGPESRPGGRRPSGRGPSGRRPGEGGLLHRLDRGTAGLVLFARDAGSLAFLLAEQAAGRIEKEYLACVVASPADLPGSRPARGLIEGGGEEGSFIECRFRSFGPRGARVACIGLAAAPGGGRAARAAGSVRYRTWILGEDRVAAAVSRKLFPEARGLRVRILKGFRHQVRAQLAWVGLPILGDPLYGGAPAPRLFLEAVSLRFRDPGCAQEWRRIAT